MDDFERKIPTQESADARKLATNAKSPRDDVPDPDAARDEHEQPKGDLGEVVKAEYKVEATDADERGKAEPRKDPHTEAHAKGLRGEALKKAVDKAEAKAAPKKAKGDPAKLREEIADLQAKVATGQATPKQKVRITEAQAELDDAEKVDG